MELSKHEKEMMCKQINDLCDKQKVMIDDLKSRSKKLKKKCERFRQVIIALLK